jgi:hypothetical protein
MSITKALSNLLSVVLLITMDENDDEQFTGDLPIDDLQVDDYTTDVILMGDLPIVEPTIDEQCIAGIMAAEPYFIPHPPTRLSLPLAIPPPRCDPFTGADDLLLVQLPTTRRIPREPGGAESP